MIFEQNSVHLYSFFPVPSPLRLRVIQKSKTLDSAALATQERLTRYRFSQGETLRERYRIVIDNYYQ
ncbi:MAG TPA: hypothetical protein VE944_25680 [Nostoc sp.]|nr:hypothetical protein [Nostoc sp.]